MSAYFSLSTCIEGKKHTVTFEDGKLIKDEIKDCDQKEHGTFLRFIPSKKYLGKSADIPFKDVLKWVKTISYLLEKNIKVVFDIFNGFERLEHHKFKPLGVKALLQESMNKALTDIMSFSGNINLEELFRDRKIKRKLNLSFAFGYNNDLTPYIDSYCNYVNTVDGGVHLDAVKEGIVRFFVNKVKASMSEREKEKMDILWIDVTTGLNMIVNINTDMQIQFASQTKEKVSNEDLNEPLKKLSMNLLEEYFNSNKDKLNQFIKFIKLNAKARIEANKAKQSIIRERTTSFDEHQMDNFVPCNNRGKNQYRELYIVEGKSAKGSVVNGRDPATQAVFCLRGVTANALKCSLTEIMENREWRDLVKILGCNIGSAFDITKLKYNKIIILTDADIDGDGITSLIATFFMTHLPEIVEAGILYKAVTPLYKVKSKVKEFVANKKEFVELFEDNVIKNYKLAPISYSNDYIDKNEFSDFIYDTKTYLEELVSISKHYGLKGEHIFLEKVVGAFVGMDNPIDILTNNNNFRLAFVSAIQKDYPEMILNDNNIIRGVINGKYRSLSINSRFFRKVRELYDVMNKYGYIVKVKEKKSDNKMKITIGEFLQETSKYIPKIVHRYKGLGESNPDVLAATTLSIEDRHIIQLTSDDIMRDRLVFNVLHGDTAKDKDDRKKMMRGFKISKDELDN